MEKNTDFNILLKISLFLKQGLRKMVGLTYPEISPVAVHLFGFDVRWYSLAYLFGIVAAWYLMWRNIQKYKLDIEKKSLDDTIFNVTLGIILGGRIFYVLFYNFSSFLMHPLEIFALWHGGMSFHGGLTGAIIGLWIGARQAKCPFFKLADLAALYTPIGLFLGRLANFINDELWGRITDVPWAVRFPSGGGVPRHPSQIYEAMLEGVVMFAVLNFLWHFRVVRQKQGFVSGLFLALYALMRMFVEYFRQPDEQLGFIISNVTMGQLLSVPVLFAGITIIVFACRKGKAQS